MIRIDRANEAHERTPKGELAQRCALVDAVMQSRRYRSAEAAPP